MYYSKSTNGFYSEEIHGENIPSDSIEISEETWRSLVNGQSQGKTLSSDKKGNPILVDPPLPTKDQTIAALSKAIQSSLDTSATTWGYDSILSGCSYANSTNNQYAADATVLISWRDSVWEWANNKFKSVTPGTTPDEFMQDIPLQPTKPIVD